MLGVRRLSGFAFARIGGAHGLGRGRLLPQKLESTSIRHTIRLPAAHLSSSSPALVIVTVRKGFSTQSGELSSSSDTMSSSKPTGARTAMDEIAQDGAFKRTEATFRDWIRADGSTPYAPEAGRYHLYVSYACPWVC